MFYKTDNDVSEELATSIYSTAISLENESGKCYAERRFETRITNEKIETNGSEKEYLLGGKGGV